MVAIDLKGSNLEVSRDPSPRLEGRGFGISEKIGSHLQGTRAP